MRSLALSPVASRIPSRGRAKLKAIHRYIEGHVPHFLRLTALPLQLNDLVDVDDATWRGFDSSRSAFDDNYSPSKFQRRRLPYMTTKVCAILT
jgi:hypothetical protein